jgi:hypothetical protein
MTLLYLTFGFIWTNYALFKNSKKTNGTKEYWFAVILFGMLLWPFFTYEAYSKGFITEDLSKLNDKMLLMRIKVRRWFTRK